MAVMITIDFITSSIVLGIIMIYICPGIRVNPNCFCFTVSMLPNIAPIPVFPHPLSCPHPSPTLPPRPL